MASKKKVNLADYDLTTTLGTGKYFTYVIVIKDPLEE